MRTTLTGKEIETYRDNGFVVVENFLDADELELWRSALEVALSRRADRKLPDRASVGTLDDDESYYDSVFTQRLNLWVDNPEIADLIINRDIGRMVGAKLPGTDVSGGYSPYLFLNSSGGLTQGREVHGQPKKFADPILEVRSDTFVGQIGRDGIDVATVTAPYKHQRADISDLAKHFDFAINLNLKAIDHITGKPAIRQLTSRRLTDVHGATEGSTAANRSPQSLATGW